MRIKAVKKDLGDYSDIKERFREVRLSKRMTQADMAKVVGLTPGSVGAIEQGLYTPSFKVLRALHSKLGVNYGYLIDGVNEDLDTLMKTIEKLEVENAMLRRVVDKLTK